MDKEERYERYRYLTGLSAWEIASFQDKDNLVVLNDGPSGLRKPKDNDFTHQQDLIQTVCLPTPSALAASFDPDVAYGSSSSIAQECLAHGANILLAPGINIKKYVLCGRNFEYFSEDPFLTGVLAASYVNGLEEHGVGACLKHYACNSQEFARTINSSIVSKRALNEIYLRSFQIALQRSKPTAIMTSYNRVNGEYVNESPYLIQKKLRGEFGFSGLIMSDWCGISDKGKALKNGISLEMPKTKMSNEYIDRGYQKTFDDEDLRHDDDVLYASIKKFKGSKRKEDLDLNALHSKAVSLAEQTMVLVKNEDHYLPLRKEDKVLVLGYFANHSRFVGNGSGFVNAYQKDTFLDALNRGGFHYEFLECFNENGLQITKEDLLAYQGKFDKVLLFLGQYQFDESEGFDRSTISLSSAQKEMIDLAGEVFKVFGVILTTGSVVDIKDIIGASKAMVITYLAGEGQAEALFRNIYGIHNPSGRLPETWISSILANPHNAEHLKKDVYQTLYTDDIYVGYRYYDLHDDGVTLPFGFGLSYSSFSYRNIHLKRDEDVIRVYVTVSNDSARDGEDVIQIYVGKERSSIYRPKKELKGFKKIFVPAKSEKECCVEISLSALKSYQEESDSFQLEEGEYQFYIAKNVHDVIEVLSLSLEGVPFQEKKEPVALKSLPYPTQISLNSPASVLRGNKVFYQFAASKGIDVADFESRFPWINEKALRVLIGDEDLKISFEEMEELIGLLNQKEGGAL